MKMYPLSFLVALFGLSINVANAALVATNWNVVGSTLSFELSGTIDTGTSVGPTASNTIYIGVSGDTDWVTTNGTTRNITNNSGPGIRDVRTNSGGYFTLPTVDIITLQTADVAPWAAGDTVSATIELSGGAIDLSNLDLDSVIISAGFTTAADRPELAHQVGEAVVPEPSTSLLTFVAIACCAMRRRQ